MKNRLTIVFVILVVLLAGAFFAFTFLHENEPYSTSIALRQIYHDSFTGKVTKVVYDATGSENLSAYRQDCIQHGGFFEECGNICEPGATACVEVCGVTCTF